MWDFFRNFASWISYIHIPMAKGRILFVNQEIVPFTGDTEQGVLGRYLPAKLQEMGREINTMGSKANHAEIQKWVVKMKDELEKIKEQSLNIL